MGRLKNRYHEELMKNEPMTSTTDVMEEEHITITGMTSKELQEAAHTNAEDWYIPITSMPSKELQDATIKNLDIPLCNKPLVEHVMSYSQATDLLSKSILYNEKVSPTQLKIAWKRILVEIDNA
tara:strand:+ start:5549 stop:5920 length:372 start_codon:yes stop_codon:yes gene_type:complete